MRATYLRVLMLLAMPVVLTPAGSEETQAADATVTADATVAAASKVRETDKADAADEADEAKAKGEFKVPPGFRVKTRGKYTLYCRSESVMGTNFKSEKCYDETGIRELIRAQREDKVKMDQMRAICGQTGSCGGT